MFRQALLLVCLIALTTSASAWFGIGTREEGDQLISIQTAFTLETTLPTNHTINMLFDGGVNTFTYARFDVEEDWNSLDINSGIDNGFNVTIGAKNATFLTVQATIFGFLQGQVPINFVPKIIKSKSIRMN